jgi:hypothetical protein
VLTREESWFTKDPTLDLMEGITERKNSKAKENDVPKDELMTALVDKAMNIFVYF